MTARGKQTENEKEEVRNTSKIPVIACSVVFSLPTATSWPPSCTKKCHSHKK